MSPRDEAALSTWVGTFPDTSPSRRSIVQRRLTRGTPTPNPSSRSNFSSSVSSRSPSATIFPASMTTIRSAYLATRSRRCSTTTMVSPSSLRRSSVWLITSSFFFSSRRRHTRCSRDWSSDVCSSDLLHVLLLAELARHGSEDAGRPRLTLFIDDHDCVLVEADVGSVLAAGLLCRAHDDRARHVRLLDRAVGQRVLHGNDHDIAQRRVAPARSAK